MSMSLISSERSKGIPNKKTSYNDISTVIVLLACIDTYGMLLGKSNMKKL